LGFGSFALFEIDCYISGSRRTSDSCPSSLKLIWESSVIKFIGTQLAPNHLDSIRACRPVVYFSLQ
ncbi:MAG: hypothetical protein P8J82_01490, partial [Tateyamaria sp.]|nr:hypothetical protein [Tateyamaria sp.]